jgi:hypothetical protein
MKNYALFAGSNYYPAGGIHDLVDCFETLEDAIDATAQRADDDWWHIVNVATKSIVASLTRSFDESDYCGAHHTTYLGF